MQAVEEVLPLYTLSVYRVILSMTISWTWQWARFCPELNSFHYGSSWFLLEQVNLNIPWEINVCTCGFYIRIIFEQYYEYDILSRSGVTPHDTPPACTSVWWHPFPPSPQLRLLWTQRSGWDLWHDVWKPCYFIATAPSISKQRQGHQSCSYLKKNKKIILKQMAQKKRYYHHLTKRKNSDDRFKDDHTEASVRATQHAHTIWVICLRTRMRLLLLIQLQVTLHLHENLSKQKHQFLKHSMNAFTLSGKIVLPPPKDDIWSKKHIYMIQEGPEHLLSYRGDSSV